MKYPIFAVLVAITIAGTLAGVSATAEPEKVGAPGIVNFSRIEGQTGFAGTIVGFGGATDSSAMHWLKNEGFASVINLRLTSEEGANIDNSRAAAIATKYINDLGIE